MLKGQNQNSQETALENLQREVLRSIGRFRLIGEHFEDPAIDGVYQAIKQLEKEKTLPNLEELKAKVEACQGKNLPTDKIYHAIATFKTSLQTQSNDESSSRFRP